MTRDEILNMPAGNEINKLIAINVMGWALVINHGEAGGKFWIGHGGSFGDMPERDLTDFSGDMNDAKSVSDKMNHFVLVRTRYQGKIEYCCNHIAFADTIPLAICRAALLAVIEVK